MSTDRIEKTVVLRAPRSRVWRALTDAGEFGTWFRVALEGPFVAGATVRGRTTYPGYEGKVVEMSVERMDAERLVLLPLAPVRRQSRGRLLDGADDTRRVPAGGGRRAARA